MSITNDNDRPTFTGWNTWSTGSVMTQVRLPERVALSLGLKEYRKGRYLRAALIGRQGTDDEVVTPGLRSWDGSYVSFDVAWEGIRIAVASAAEGETLRLLVEPVSTDQVRTPVLVVRLGLVWGAHGTVGFHGGFEVQIDGAVYRPAAGREPVVDLSIPEAGPCLCYALDAPVALEVHRAEAGAANGQSARGRAGRGDAPVDAEQVRLRLRSAREALVGRDGQAHADGLDAGAPDASAGDASATDASADVALAHEVIRQAIAWDTIYDPANERVIAPVSRIWSVGQGGYVLFDWDTYFAAMLAGVQNRDYAYANAMAITSEVTPDGFIPNITNGTGFTSLDRSQPPVGSLCAVYLHERYADDALLQALYPTLLGWNRWWSRARDVDGYLCWGSNSYAPRTGNYWELTGVGERFGAALESGLDNSPMYDEMPFDRERGVMLLADVGLMGMYVADCLHLATVARVLGHEDDADELAGRAERYGSSLASLWDEETGLFLNRRLDTGKSEHRLSPTHFYPLLSAVPTEQQARRMVDEHLYNEQEFWGDWVLPSIARNDPAFPDQDYWRGRVWAPMNFLVYLGLCNYDLPDARRDLADRSFSLLAKEWREHRYVCENYSAITGSGSDRPNSDRFYHWGALLGLVSLMEHGEAPVVRVEQGTGRTLPG